MATDGANIEKYKTQNRGSKTFHLLYLEEWLKPSKAFDNTQDMTWTEYNSRVNGTHLV